MGAASFCFFMFQLGRNFCAWVRSRTQVTMSVVLTGLDNAGKTSVLSCIKGAPDDSPIPTMGQGQPHKRKHKSNLEVGFMDLGGGKKIRGIWEKYYGRSHGLIFVVDATARDRVDEAKETLHSLIKHGDTVGKPLLIFGNKQDLDGAMTVDELFGVLELSAFPQLEVKIIACTAKVSSGTKVDPALMSGVDWLSSRVQKKFKDIEPAVQTWLKEEAERQEKRREEVRIRTEQRKAARRAAEAKAAADAAAASSVMSPTAPAASGDTASNGSPITTERNDAFAGSGGGDGNVQSQVAFSDATDATPAQLRSPPTPAIPELGVTSPGS